MPVRRRRVRNRFRMDQGFGQPFTLNRDSPQAQGLVAWWPTLGQGGDALRDLSGHSMDGTLGSGSSQPTWVRDSERGETLSFGSDDYIAMANLSALPTGSGVPWTLVAWANLNSLTPGYMAIIIYGTEATGEAPHLYVSDTDRWRVSVWGSAGANSPSAPSLNKWTHITGVCDGSNVKLFLDGILVAGPVSLTNAPTNTALRVGNRLTSTNQAFSGMISDTRIYNRALTASEVYQMYAPQTRWDLYKPLPRVFYMYTGGLSIPVAMASYRRRRIA